MLTAVVEPGGGLRWVVCQVVAEAELRDNWSDATGAALLGAILPRALQRLVNMILIGIRNVQEPLSS